MHTRVLSVIEDLERFMQTVDDALAIPRDAAEFTFALLRATRVRRAVEIGTSYGYSGLWIAAALAEGGANGKLITIDHQPRKSGAASAYFRSAGLERFVDLRTGPALEILPSLEGPIEFVLNDADKENCVRYVELLLEKLADRAVVLTDNTISHADEVAAFVGWVRSHPSFVSASVPVGNGMEMSVKVGGAQP